MPEKKIKANDNVINILLNFDNNGKKKGNKNTKDMRRKTGKIEEKKSNLEIIYQQYI